MSGVEQRLGQEKGIGPDLANKTVTLYHIMCSDFCSDLCSIPCGGERGQERVLRQRRLGSRAVEKSSEPETKIERKERNVVTFDSVCNASISDYPTYRARKPFVGCGEHGVLLEETAFV